MKTTAPLLILIDASGYLFRAYHGLPKLTNAHGEPTGALIGVLNSLHKSLNQYQYDYLGVVFDTPEPTFRDQLFSEYKANRPPSPNDLIAQIAPLQLIIRALGYPLLIMPGIEADDVIGSLATHATAAGFTTLIFTSDKDLAQLVNDHVTLFDPVSERHLDRDGVIAKFGVAPERIADYLTLVGDPSDNLPGVPHCGAKTAAKWLATYGDLDGIVANAATISGRVGDSLRSVIHQLPLMRQLVTIDCQLPAMPELTELKPQPPDYDSLRNWYTRLEARRLLATLPPAPSHSIHTAPRYLRVSNADSFNHAVALLTQTTQCAVTIFTDDATDWRRNHHDQVNHITGIAFAIHSASDSATVEVHSANTIIDIPFNSTDTALDRATIITALQPLLSAAQTVLIVQDLKRHLHLCAQLGIAIVGTIHDVLLAEYVFNGRVRHTSPAPSDPEFTSDQSTAQLTLIDLTTQSVLPHAALELAAVFNQYQTLASQLNVTPALLTLYQTLELPLAAVLMRMEQVGVRIDCQELAVLSEEFAARAAVLATQAHDCAGQVFNLNSPQQVSTVLFDQLKLTSQTKTRGGARSTAESVLEQLADEGEQLPRLILNYRTLTKLRSTYTDKLPRLINPMTGRIHTHYQQTTVVTGRLSSTDPNLQNIPIRGEEGRRIRRAFIPAAGYQLLAADYSQIELRLMAHLSNDERLLTAFAQGEDIHRATAAEVFEIPLAEVTPDQRHTAKAINFGLLYGMSAFGIARTLGIERSAAQEYHERYFARYPAVQALIEQVRTQAIDNGYVTTLFGRRLWIPDLNHSNQQRRRAAERAAINAPLQGSAADIIKRAMIAVDEWIIRAQFPARLILQVHDELVFEVTADAATEACQMIRQLMENAASLTVPLRVEIGVSDNWEAAH
ncbi:DNA polymerase I [Rhodoferax sp. 4810]|uniref:DNA polymerase I n=1 Tax=Thiospirillum jenense TaxID=1653858 RepID=A0A839H3T4_9GAMM|nr:DNA polymerase I [Thiospirillum jenense]MBB1072965.1 DNA polymerase I [Rhodoferax jenense]MBB1124913.1 DNA polymerase I [Thiospirillum jenense]